MNSISEDLIIGNCSKCGGPVLELETVKLGKFKECQNCGTKVFPKYKTIINMDDKTLDNKKIIEKNIPPYYVPYYPSAPSYPHNPNEIWPPYTPSPYTTPWNPYPYNQFYVTCCNK